MSEQYSKSGIPVRDFIDRIRAGLGEAGHPEIAVSRLWVDEDTPGEPFLLHVPVGPELRIPLRPRREFSQPDRAALYEGEISDFVRALINLTRAERSLRRYAKGVHRTVVSAIDAARADGLDVQVAGISFATVYAGHLSYPDWRDAAQHVLAEVMVRHTSFCLQPETSSFVIEEPECIADELRSIFEEQRERQDRLAELEHRGADVEVDAITLDILRACGLDPVQALRDVCKRQSLTFQPTAESGAKWLSLSSIDGNVTVALKIADQAAWNGEYLWFLDETRSHNLEHLAGKTLGDLLKHPVFTSRPIAHVEGRGDAGRDLIYFDLADRLLFDAESGRLWRTEQPLAA